MLALAFIGYSILAVYEFIPLFKQKLWRDFCVNTVLGIISFTAAILLSLGVKIPSPAFPIQQVITSIFGK